MFQQTKNRGISALPTILLISSILVEVGVIGVVLASTLNNSRFNERLAQDAYSAARAGAEDAMLRVIRYKDCPSDPSPGCPSSYTLEVDGIDVDVLITDEGGNILKIEATGSTLLRKKRVEAVLGVNASTGEVSLQSFKEVAL